MVKKLRSLLVIGQKHGIKLKDVFLFKVVWLQSYYLKKKTQFSFKVLIQHQESIKSLYNQRANLSVTDLV